MVDHLVAVLCTTASGWPSPVDPCDSICIISLYFTHHIFMVNVSEEMDATYLALDVFGDCVITYGQVDCGYVLMPPLPPIKSTLLQGHGSSWLVEYC